MAITVKKNGVYTAPVAIFVKKNDVYTAVQGVYAKVRGAYQAVDRVLTPAEAFIARSPTPVSDSAKMIYGNFFNSVSDILTKLDALYLLTAENRDIAKLNLAQPIYDLVEINPLGSLIFEASIGFRINSPATETVNFTNLNSGIVTSASNLKFKQDDCSMGLGSIQNRTNSTSCGNFPAATGASLILKGTSCRLTTSSSRTSPVFARAGHAVMTRSVAATFDRYVNGAFLESPTITSAAQSVSNFVVCNYQANTTLAGDFDTTTFSFIGAGLTATEISRLYYAINQYLAAYGVETLASREVSASTVAATNSLNSGSVVTTGLDTGAVTSPAVFTVADKSNGVTYLNTLAADLTTAAAATTGVSVSGTTVTIASSRTGVFNVARPISATAATGAASAMTITPVSGCYSYASTISTMQTGSTASVPPKTKGINLSGMEFGGTTTDNPFTIQNTNVDFYATKNFTNVRLPHNWSRLQHTLLGALDIVGNGTGDAEKYKATLDYITNTKGMYCIVDPHDFGGRLGTTAKLGDDVLPVAAFEDYCTKLIQYLGVTNNKIVFCLMNEPVGISAGRWAKTAQSIVYALRAAGFKGLIHVPGTSFTGAWSWITSGNAAAMTGFIDPLSNFAFEVHQYLDSDSSGTSATCTVGAGASRLDGFTDWLALVPARRGFLGEFGSAGNSQCETEVNALLNDWEASSQTVGWSAWGGGQYWASAYIFRLEDPVNINNNTIYMNDILAHLP